jgi:uncharacterized protein (DUF433 family)
VSPPIEKRADPRDVANYTLPEASRWLGLKPTTLRAWLQGRDYSTKAQAKRAPLVVEPASDRPIGLSFWNLVECSVLAALRKDHQISLQKVRKALDYVTSELRVERPLIKEAFSTDGVGLFVERYGSLIDVSRDGQIAMREVLQAGLTRIERDEDGLAARLFPWRRDPHEPRIITVDPRVSFGQPTLASTRVPVEIIRERFEAGDTIECLAADYRVNPALIEDLLRKWFVSPAA